ncbi:uncharacterized protein LOC107303675 [Oryza brachyantha]|uniref:uncharacterized protein LOC107303675 n=1 Tax=Oryza brachyantha TaxID=4533 RepID=UPI001ADC6A6E|nr:uncharacterized protein LOC107303675 [Oryza brachyantha]
MPLGFKRGVAEVRAWDAAAPHPDAAGSSGVGGGGAPPPPPPSSSPLAYPSLWPSLPGHLPCAGQEEAGIEWTFDPCLHKYWNATHGKFRCQVPRQQQQNMLSNTHGDRAVFKLQKSFFENFILCNITGRSKHHALPKFNLYAEDESRDIMVTSRGSEISLVSSGFGRRQTLVLSHQQVQIECDGHTVASPICRFVLSFLQHVKSASELLRSWMRFIKLFALKLFYCWMAPAIKRFLPMLTRLSWFSIMGDPMLQTEEFMHACCVHCVH